MKSKPLLYLITLTIVFTACKKSVINKSDPDSRGGGRGSDTVKTPEQLVVDQSKIFGAWRSVSKLPDYPVRYFGKDGLYYEKVNPDYHFGSFYWGSNDSLTFTYDNSITKARVKVLKLNSDSLVFVTTIPYIYRYIISSRQLLSAGGGIETIAGDNVLYGYDDGRRPAKTARTSYPSGVTVDNAGNIYFFDSYNYRIRRIDPKDSTITTICGNDNTGFNWGEDNTEPLSTSLSYYSKSLSRDNAGNLYFLQTVFSTYNNCIYKLSSSDNRLHRLTGLATGFAGDGGPAANALTDRARDIAVDGAGNIFIADQNGTRVRKIAAKDGTIQTIAGNGVEGNTGDGGKAIDASIKVYTMALDAMGNIYIASQYVVRKIDVATGKISTITGTGQNKVSGDNVDATKASFSNICSLLIGSNGDVYIGEAGSGTSLLRKIDHSSNIITRIAGDGGDTFNGDGKYPTLRSTGPLPYNKAVKAAYYKTLRKAKEMLCTIEQDELRYTLVRSDTPTSTGYIVHEFINPLLYLRLEAENDSTFFIHFGIEQVQSNEHLSNITSKFIRALYSLTNKKATATNIEMSVRTDWLLNSCSDAYEYIEERNKYHVFKQLPYKVNTAKRKQLLSVA
ncbi:MAG: hypothetical protein V4520_18555 [Bacteroidota bacterium]